MLFLLYFICITFFKGIYGENIELNIPIERRQDEPTTNLTNPTETPDFTSDTDITVSSEVSNPVTTTGMITSSDSTEITTVSIPDTESTDFIITTSVSVTSEIPESTSTELTVSTNSITTTEEITSSIISDSTIVTEPTTTSNPETTTFISNAVDYDEECRRIFTWSRNVISFTPIFPVPCRYYCRVNGIRLYFPFKDRDFTACGNEMVCLKGTCAERPNAEDAAYCNNLFPGRRMTVIRDFFSCYMKCYDLNSSQTYLTRAQNGSSCRSRLLNFDGICSDGFCVRQ